MSCAWCSRRAIDRLADGAREVFVLRDVEGMSTAEVAAALDVSEDVVKTRLSRARAAIRRDLTARTGSSALDVFRFYRPRCDRVVAGVLSRIAADLLTESFSRIGAGKFPPCSPTSRVHISISAAF